MIIVDIETSGVDCRLCSILSIGAVDFADPKNQFYEECRIFDGAHVEKEALGVNGFTREQISDPKKQTDKEIVEKFLAWMKTTKEWTIGGQNPSFDRDFLQYTAYRYHINWPLAHRIIDLHSVAYFHMKRKGIEPPQKNSHSALSLDGILTYVGMQKEPHPHNALTGAKLEAEAFSRLFNEKPFFDEYKTIPITFAFPK